MTSSEVTNLAHKYVYEVKNILTEDFLSAVLYGSYARGDFNNDSDVDIAIFTNCSPKEYYQLFEQIAELTFEFNAKYDVLISPIFLNIHVYQENLSILPFYQNIEKEGIKVG